MRAIHGTFVVGLVLLASTDPVRAQGGRVLADMPCPVDEPMGMAVRGEHLWISDMATRTVLKVNKADGSVLEKLSVPGFQPTGLAWHEDTMFASDRWLDKIARRRPEKSADLSPIPYYERWAMGMAHDGEHLWVADHLAAKLHQIDPEDGTTIKSFDAPAAKPIGITFDGHYLWVSDHKTDEIYMVDRKDGHVLAILPAPGPYPSALAADGDSLWVADYEERRLYRVALPDKTPYVEDEPRRVRASYDVLYRARDEGKIANLVSYLALPRDIPGQHLLGELRFEPEPTRIETDRWGQKVAVFELGELESGQLRSVRWVGDFALYRVRFHVVPERVEAARLPKGMDAYLVDDKKYDLGSKTVAELVDELTKEELSYYWRARAIYQHLTDVITYDRSSGWNNAATVLERGTGSCSEYTFALVALLRRAGIPARYVGAISERDGDASFDDVFHRWAEAYMPGYGWIPIDANAGQGKQPGERGQYFGGRSNRHVVTTIGGGASEYMEWKYNNYETYESQGQAKLEWQEISRYRPLEGDAKTAKVAPHDAPEVLAPRLTEPVERGKPVAQKESSRSRFANPWTMAIALLLAVLLGFLIGGRGRARAKHS